MGASWVEVGFDVKTIRMESVKWGGCWEDEWTSDIDVKFAALYNSDVDSMPDESGWHQERDILPLCMATRSTRYSKKLHGENQNHFLNPQKRQQELWRHAIR